MFCFFCHRLLRQHNPDGVMRRQSFFLFFLRELHLSKLPSTKHLPTHSLSVICRATVLWTRNGRPEPLPEVQEWSSRSWKEQKHKVIVYFTVTLCKEEKKLPKELKMMKYRASGTQMGINTSKLSLMWHPHEMEAGMMCASQDNVLVCACVCWRCRAPPHWVNNRGATSSLVTSVGAGDLI